MSGQDLRGRLASDTPMNVTSTLPRLLHGTVGKFSLDLQVGQILSVLGRTVYFHTSNVIPVKRGCPPYCSSNDSTTESGAGTGDDAESVRSVAATRPMSRYFLPVGLPVWFTLGNADHSGPNNACSVPSAKLETAAYVYVAVDDDVKTDSQVAEEQPSLTYCSAALQCGPDAPLRKMPLVSTRINDDSENADDEEDDLKLEQRRTHTSQHMEQYTSKKQSVVHGGAGSLYYVNDAPWQSWSSRLHSLCAIAYDTPNNRCEYRASDEDDVLTWWRESNSADNPHERVMCLLYAQSIKT